MNTSIDQDGESLNISKDKKSNPAVIATADQQDESSADSG